MLQLSESPPMRILPSLEEAYELCREITAKYAKTFYLGTLLMPQDKRQAIWALYAWCRRTDEMVDGPQSALTTNETLDHWEERLESIFMGHPSDGFDLALVDTVQRFPLDIKPFRDMIAGQRMDLYRSRYQTFDELNLYCYRVAGTVGLMSLAVMGVDTTPVTTPWDLFRPHETDPTHKAVALGVAKQLTNILRDVGEDARRGRVYLPLCELSLFNYSEQDLMDGVIDDRWRQLMQFQIQRARSFYAEAEWGISVLNPDARWPIWSALIHYREILKVIERNDYDVFHHRAFVPFSQKLLSLPVAFMRAKVL